MCFNENIELIKEYSTKRSDFQYNYCYFALYIELRILLFLSHDFVGSLCRPNKYRLSDANIKRSASCLYARIYNLIIYQTLSPLGSMNREEVFVLQTFFIRRYFVVNGCSCFQQEREKNFSKKFSKTPPKNRFLFQTSERTFNFLFKIPPFFRFPVQTSEGV